MYKISFLFESVLFGTNYCDIPNCLIICMHQDADSASMAPAIFNYSSTSWHVSTCSDADAAHNLHSCEKLLDRPCAFFVY